jgi:hypothetical protein
MAIGACGETADGPAGVGSCGELADMYIMSFQDAIDAVELADPEIPDGMDGGEDQERLDRIFHIIGGLDWVELHADIAVRWGELACEPANPAEVFRSRASALSYETPVGEFMASDYFDL